MTSATCGLPVNIQLSKNCFLDPEVRSQTSELRFWLRKLDKPTSDTHSFRELVGLGRLELPTSPLSGVRSNQLSYRPGRRRTGTGGADRDRTDDLLNANQALSQLSYSPSVQMTPNFEPVARDRPETAHQVHRGQIEREARESSSPALVNYRTSTREIRDSDLTWTGTAATYSR